MVKNGIWCTPGIHTGTFNGLLITLDMLFEQKDVNFASYADDNTPYLRDKSLEVILSKLQICALKLVE